jgi:DinB superfamily
MSQAAPRDGLLASLAVVPDRVAVAARAASVRPVAPGEWTTEQVVRHLIAVETDVHQARLRDLATIDEPRWSWTEPGPWSGEPDLDLDGVLRRFADLRAETLAIIGALDDAGWARSGHHATFGALDVAGVLRNAVDHDEEHLSGLGDG